MLQAICVAMALWTGTAHAFPAIVYSVHDGDTVTILDQGHMEHCRIAGIDAPELAAFKWGDQPYAYEAHAELANLILGQTVDVQDMGQRSYNRMVCRIKVKGLDVQEKMVSDGMAWSATQFEPVSERDPLIPLLAYDARAHRRGLWGQAGYVAPWDWRHEGMHK